MKHERWQRVEKLFHDVLACDIEQRSIYLDKVCADDAALRAEVETLIVCNDAAKAKKFLDRSPIKLIK